MTGVLLPLMLLLLPAAAAAGQGGKAANAPMTAAAAASWPRTAALSAAATAASSACDARDICTALSCGLEGLLLTVCDGVPVRRLTGIPVASESTSKMCWGATTGLLLLLLTLPCVLLLLLLLLLPMDSRMVGTAKPVLTVW